MGLELGRFDGVEVLGARVGLSVMLTASYLIKHKMQEELLECAESLIQDFDKGGWNTPDISFEKSWRVNELSSICSRKLARNTNA